MREAFQEGGHLTADDLAAYLDRKLDAADRDRVENHLAHCAECRKEAAAVSSLLKRAPGQGRRWHVMGPAVAAAAVVALLLWPGSEGTGPAIPAHREDPTVVEDLPNPVLPMGTVESARRFQWHPADGADRYRLTLYDEAGMVLWKGETERTSLTLPDSVSLEPEETYLWRVEARTGIDRWIASEMARFDVEPGAEGSPGDGGGQEARPP